MAPEDMIHPGTLPPDGGARTSLMTTTLDSRYTQTTGRVFLNGTQALVRLMLNQARNDAAAGLSTGGMASGYRGSPLATLDQELWRANRHLDAHAIEFIPAVNEEMAATIMPAPSRRKANPRQLLMVCFRSGTAKGPVLTGRSMPSSTAMRTAARPMAAC